MSKHYLDADSALSGLLFDGMTISVGGFGLCGIPHDLIMAVKASGVKELTIVSNNMGVDGKGLGVLLENNQVKRVVASYVGENKLFAQQFLDGALEVEFNPQGTLAERLRAGGAGIAGFYTKTGVGTPVAEGKQSQLFDGEEYILERGIVADLALVRAHRGDGEGNLTYRYTARNFNPLVAMSSKQTVVEVEHFLGENYLDPNQIDTPGIFVQRTITASDRVKDIEQLTVRSRSEVN